MNNAPKPTYQNIPETTADLPCADLVTIDLSLLDQLNGKQTLASQLKTAINTAGFFYVINFGLSEADRVSPEKEGHFGWKPRGSRKQQYGLVDSLELYDDPKWNGIYKEEYERPPPLAKAAERAERFQRHLAFGVLRRLLILSAIIMELPDEEALWKLHDYEFRSQCHLRYMLYHPRSEAELDIMRRNKVEHNVYGHTDFGTFTLLMRQPIAGLQVRPYGEESWKYVKPFKGSITVNVADTLSFLTGGYLESSIHRVVLPPEDQRHLPRYGVIYCAGPDNSTLLEPVRSPLLDRECIKGNNHRAMPPQGVTAGEWVSARFGSIDKNYANNKDNVIVVKSVGVASYA